MYLLSCCRWSGAKGVGRVTITFKHLHAYVYVCAVLLQMELCKGCWTCDQLLAKRAGRRRGGICGGAVQAHRCVEKCVCVWLCWLHAFVLGSAITIHIYVYTVHARYSKHRNHRTYSQKYVYMVLAKPSMCMCVCTCLCLHLPT